MNKEIDNIFVDVRNAFRLLNRYQKRILQIVSYVREQTPYTDMWGWDFLYGYIFEYYFGRQRIDKKNAEMSIFQISDDGYFISSQEKKHMTDIASFTPSEQSHSYLIFNLSVFPTKVCNLWLSDPSFPDDEWDDFLTKFLSSSSDTKITRNEKGEVTILKKYEMQRFSSQQSADEVIRDFGRIAKDNTGIELFKKVFYE